MSTRRIREALVWAKEILEPEELAAALAEADALDAMSASMDPTRLESPDPTTIEGALASLRLWRGGARHLHARLSGIADRLSKAGSVQIELEATRHLKVGEPAPTESQ